jgi:hypothetical protein
MEKSLYWPKILVEIEWEQVHLRCHSSTRDGIGLTGTADPGICVYTGSLNVNDRTVVRE